MGSITEGFGTRVLAGPKDFEGLIHGYTTLRAITFVLSPDLLLSFLDDWGFQTVEVIVGYEVAGEKLNQQYREALAEKPLQITERLHQLMEEKRLTIYVPDRPIHSKLYILESDGEIRVIQGSANFTETARRGRQINYVWYWDFPQWSDQEPLKRLAADYESHLKHCTPFMNDLQELVRGREGEEKQQIIRAWLHGSPEEVDEEASLVLGKLTDGVLTPGNAEPIYRLELPAGQRARRQLERFLAPLEPRREGNVLVLNKTAYLKYERLPLPLMKVDLAAEHVIIGLRGEVITRTNPSLDPAKISAGLEHIEGYINAVELGQTRNEQICQMTKTSLYEALLYVLSAPFMNEYMKRKHMNVGRVDSRGPRFLHITGGSSNGKTTFLRFSLKLLSGSEMDPHPGAEFSKGRVRLVTDLGTSFPMVFDDVPSTKFHAAEEVLKSYWDTWWNPTRVFPQIVLTSNRVAVKDWMQTRIKRVEFDVHFTPTMENKAKVNDLFRLENRIFESFSYLYLKGLKEETTVSEDELEQARRVMEELYRIAGRPLPVFFPREPVEKLYDPGRKRWLELLDLGKAELSQEGDSVIVTFSPDIQNQEIPEYSSYLSHIKHHRRGHTLVVESPAEFRSWLGLDIEERRPSILRRLMSSLRRPA